VNNDLRNKPSLGEEKSQKSMREDNVFYKKNKYERKKKEKKTGTTGYQVRLIKKWVTWQLINGVC